MAATHKGELSASMAILGLLIQEPDTAAGVSQRLARRFPRARFARSAVHNTLPSLERQGLVRVAGGSAGHPLERYDATADGVATFAQWLSDSTDMPPAQRDLVHAKLAFAERDDLLDLIGAVNREEQACSEEYAAAHARLAAARLPTTPGERDWRSRLHRVMMGDEATLWLLRVKRLQRLRAALELLADETQAQRDTGSRSSRSVSVADARVRGSQRRIA